MGATAVEVCVTIADLPPPSRAVAHVVAGHRCIGAAMGSVAGYVVLVARCEPPEGDPLAGFRPVHAFSIGAAGVLAASTTREILMNDRRFLDDPIMRRMTAESGRHRVYHDSDPRLDPALRGSIDAELWQALGLVDRIKLVHVIDEQTELHVGFDRGEGERPFDADDERLLRDITPGIGPWARRVAVLHGEGPGLQPLSPRERDALCLLLGATAQKEHGPALGLSDARARELTRIVYRKLGVVSRAALMATWHGARPGEPELPVLSLGSRRRKG